MSNFYDPPNAISVAGMAHTTVDDAVTATGSTSQTVSYAITKQVTVVSTAASGTGVLLPVAPGVVFTVKNNGANTLKVYPPVGVAINGGSANAKVDLTATSVGKYVCIPSENEQPGETVRYESL